MTIYDRLAFDGDGDFRRLLAAFRGDHPFFLVPTGLETHFAIARRKPARFRDHRPVLAVSFGGSNTSVMLASVEHGVPVVHHAIDRPNPVAPQPLDAYLDEILLAEAPFAEYLKSDPAPRLGISVAVMVRDGVPYHPSKLKTVTGLVADDPVAEAGTHHLGRNLAAYLAARGCQPAPVFYEGDAPVAHLGGVGLADIGEDDRSLLMVCGNGMACADYRRFIVCGMYCCLCDDDPDLYRPEETENGQYQYLIAGKGIYKLLRRAAEIHAEEPGSALAGIPWDEHFASDVDTAKVYHVWSSGLDGDAHPDAAALRDAVGEAAYAELQKLAGALVARGISCLANCILSSIVLNGPAPSGAGYRLFLEGSIGTNPYVVPRLEAELRRLTSSSVLAATGEETPAVPEVVRDLPPARPAPGVDPSILRRVDLTLIGAAQMAVAQDCIEQGC